jgi:hypothetical protein
VNRNKMISISVISVAIVALAVTAVSASLSRESTPLYKYRMEQLSNKMSFSPTKVSDFAYTAKGEYTLDCSVSGTRGAIPAGPVSWGRITCDTCDPTCWSGCYTNQAVGC